MNLRISTAAILTISPAIAVLAEIQRYRSPRLQANRSLGQGQPRFLIVAPSFTHRSAGVRALFRLCHHLNRAGYPSAVIPTPNNSIDDYSPWEVFGYEGEIDDAVVIYPEIISGNPYEAAKVVRWALNDPGLLGGDKHYADNEIVFVYDPQKIHIVNAALKSPIGSDRVLWVGVVDPSIIYPDLTVEKNIDCSFCNKGYSLSIRFPLDPALGVKRLEDITPDAGSLGNVLRRTRTLYSYDHYSNLLREAAICGCDVRVIDSKGVWHDPEHCDCRPNIVWSPGFRQTYKAQFYDSSIVHDFISRLPPSWHIRRQPWLRRLTHDFRKRIHFGCTDRGKT